MQNRKAVIALLIVTGLVWGMIVYRIIKTIRGNDTVHISDTFAVPPPLSSHPIDTFALIGDYRDPFLGSTIIAHKPIVQVSQAPPVKTTPPAPSAPLAPFPTVNYLGRVRNNDSQKKVAIMMVKSGIKNMSEGESYNDVTLMKIMGDSVLVNYQKEQKVIAKSGRKHASGK